MDYICMLWSDEDVSVLVIGLAPHRCALTLGFYWTGLLCETQSRLGWVPRREHLSFYTDGSAFCHPTNSV